MPVITLDEDFLAATRRRYDTDAEFHYRVKAIKQMMAMTYANPPDGPHIALVLAIDEMVCKENGLKR